MANDDRRRVLDLLADGKITAEEAERLLKALDRQKSYDESPGATLDDKIEQAVTSTVRSAVATAHSVVAAVGSGEFETLQDQVDTFDGDRREISFRVEGIPTLVVENFNGRVEILGDNSEGDVRVVASIRHPELVDYAAIQEGDAILVRAKPSGKRTFLGWRFLSRGARIRISAPRKAKVDVRTSNGRAILRRIEGAGTLLTSNGRVQADAVSGTFDMRTSNSRIEATRLDGDFKLGTSNGSVTVRDGRGTFDVETSNGGIRFDGEFSSRKANRLVTSNASISAALDGEPSLRVNARTSNGSITCRSDMAIQGERKKRQLEGVMGDGDGSLTLRTSNGSITIE